MTLITALERTTSATIQSRGREYFRRGAVRNIGLNKNTIKAAVQGSSLYQVRIEFIEGDEIGFACSCPYFESNDDVCKHVWAVFLAAERDRLPPEWKSKHPPDLFPDDIEDSDDDDEDEFDDEDAGGNFLDEDDEEDDEEDHTADRSTMSKTERAQVAERMKQFWRQRRGGLFGSGQEKSSAAKQPKAPEWKQHFDQLCQQFHPIESSPEWPAGKQILYLLGAVSDCYGGGPSIETSMRELRKNGTWGKPRSFAIDYRMLPALPDPQDRQIIQLLVGKPSIYHGSVSQNHFNPSASALADLLPLICQTGRCYFSSGDRNLDPQPLAWDAGEPWKFRVGVRREASVFVLSGALHRNGGRIGLEEPAALFPTGFCIFRNRISRYHHCGAYDWVRWLSRGIRIEVPEKDHQALLQEMLELPQLPALELPEELQFEEIRGVGRPTPKIRRSPNSWERGLLHADLAFDYGGFLISSSHAHQVIADFPNRRRILRDRRAENSAIQLLTRMDFRQGYSPKGTVWIAREGVLPRAVSALTAAGWHVEAEGKLFHAASAFKIEISSGIDWFELHGTVDFGGRSAPLPALLAALKRKENMIRLDDGSVGILAEEWLRKYGMLAGMGTVEGNHLRFSRCQTGLLDALLAAEPAASCDEVFERARTRLREFDGIAPVEEGSGFCGRLREYQREGLGWIHFLREFGFGGCLADDMGLGKTIQVLALLDSRRVLRDQNGGQEERAPALVVAPRSLIFNWKQEAARFTPRLRVLDYTGAGRTKLNESFGQYDLIVTTYGTLRRDAALIKDCHFDYLILDEAQAIKNAGTASAKSARLLRGSYRLALSGTPVENHLGELWSLFEFLNPGMLGSASVFKLGQGELRKPDPAMREMLARALRPFILRRTKAQVALDLPEKVEQTLYCELDAPQRRLLR